ncbi:MAG: glucosamine-6-phosphate deaminase [Acidimicrobiales bacterium]|jgi:glucosamine-6-phosphate deaminase
MGPPGTSDVSGTDVVVLGDPSALASAAADEAATVLKAAVVRNGAAHAMFATGNSQLAFVDALVDPSRDVPWTEVTVFHMDEYVGIGPDHPASFERWIRQRIVERAHPGAAYYLDGLAVPEEECVRYAELLAAHPLDLCCLGIGENGHLAFNDPGVADFADPRDVKVVELDEACRRQQVGEGHFPSEADVPRAAVTVTIPALLRAARVLAVVPEARKAVPVRDALRGPVTTACPASILQRASHATVYLDADSAALL